MGRLNVYLRGWLDYFAPAKSKSWREDQDAWLRHRLRALRLKQLGRGPTTYREMRRLGMTERDAAAVASHRGSWWRRSHDALNKAMPVRFFDDLGLLHVAPPTERKLSNRPVRTRTPGGVAGVGPNRV